MTAAIALRRRDECKRNIAGQMLYYPEARVPFGTPADAENNTGYHLECNGTVSSALQTIISLAESRLLLSISAPECKTSHS